MEVQTLLPLPVLVALESVVGEPPARMTLERDEAAALAELVAADLLGLVPQVASARMVLAGALFDQVELLRPGFPVWAALDELALRTPRAALESVLAFGTHEGRMPTPELEPSTLYADGPMRLLPISLLAPAALVDDLSTQVELQLVGRGEAGAKTADWLMRTLGVRLEHVRYLSRNDLLALTCVQYEHVNLTPLWALLETALLTPERDESTMSARGLSLRYAGGIVLAQSPAQWLSRQTGELGQRAHDFAGIVFELRQYAALLEAHRVPLQLEAADFKTEASDGYLLETRAAADAELGSPHLFAHEAPGLGVVTVTVAQPAGAGRARVLAHGYPLQPRALGLLLQRLAAEYGIASELDALGRVVLDEAGELGVPATVLH
ncbi:MAG: hypothetical protein ABI389_01555 [Rhodanobacter sp.]